MNRPSIGRRTGVAAGFCVSLGAAFWLLSISSGIVGITNRIGFMSAVVCTFGALLFFWALGFACVVHAFNWSHRACRLAGVAFMVPGSLLYLSHARPGSVMGLVVCQAALTSYLARRIAFPELSDDEAAAPDPLPSMFPK